jgi:hypothetical protein
LAGQQLNAVVSCGCGLPDVHGIHDVQQDCKESTAAQSDKPSAAMFQHQEKNTSYPGCGNASG